MKAENPFMQLAIDEALAGIAKGNGGPFGSVVVKDGTPVGKGHNRVLSNVDSTAHGEIVAIRDAEKRLNTHDLSGCVLYTTAEPCPMCLFACLWANLDRVYFGCTIEDTGRLGFRDKHFSELVAGRDKLDGFLVGIDRTACLELFEVYRNRPHDIY
ncbi:MAG: nucleoside deaminase [Kiritimatiellae bacterium]|nr:nucleoside deaminase [Kiritimatiellia bacterium]